MKKRNLALMTAALVLALTACGGGSSSETKVSGETDKAETTKADEGKSEEKKSSAGKELRLVNGKIEVDAQLKELAAAYEKETGVKVNIESMGGGIDIQGTLKGYFQADNMPDIFVNGGDTDFKNWEGHLVDMSNEKWVSDTEAAYKDKDGKVVGFPYTTEAIGLAYNADVLEKAGIDPKSITGPDSMKKAFETLDSKKDELGLTAVVGYVAEATNLYWSTGNHLFGVYEDGGLKRDDTKYFDLLEQGKIDKDRFSKYADMVELFNKYADPSLLVSGTYDQQIQNFSAGKYAFVTQGSWIGATMTNDDKEQYEAAGKFKVGMIPYAFEEGIDTIQTNSPSWWAVFDNDNKEDALKFLQWVSEDEGQKILVEKAGFVSPFKSISYVADDPFAQTITDYTKAGKTSAWHWLGNKEGLAQNALGVVYQDFASGNLDKAKFVDTVEKVVAQYYAG
ncbi:ABC transporter substrate-binding protein [Oribacterium sp. oral taxon 108]|uniref:ABC transporter substrate-binding protein n=1 Tax=Oribacterium sp. oral taxon 108 TaxID=712414 RepID=UPI00020DD78C|nr:ABC transporter substrate-binding protein [Oribacterium sp. oral taxon 108]EGL36821.1 ABC transporter, solute-binding protein [Oribacterium sp. oral taxon 108 str. F0425]